ncbi:Rpn family recombination-promoting nuclease/putative transposase [Halorhodospira sp. 9622]|uniref:Rpn family recombination-promoting nuclease/putative transposase n=1 Tax=Halorhodospira sp. 9622 TaxID=2899136 RepID=UPI001EE89B26|nr:Rpn family recombination-promoting nuclease/putative transposase [Halorhodospira sp. 9622]MCG5539406.1 Rpn family recombination-promoting nuclease/putative transposase [Halorhodospira sp. 9622]
MGDQEDQEGEGGDPPICNHHTATAFSKLAFATAGPPTSLIEHKSAPDASTPVQLLGYMQRIWQRHAEHTPQQRAHRYRHLPPIIPLVLYNGRPDWSVPLSLLECIDADEDLRDLQRNFGYQVRHLRADDRSEPYSEDPVIRGVFRALAAPFADN